MTALDDDGLDLKLARQQAKLLAPEIECRSKA